PYQRVGVFVDVQNMYYSAKNLYGSKVNFGQILKDAVADRQLIRSVAYVVRAEEPLEQTFFDALEKAGFEVKVKDIQVFPGGVKKADWDVGVVIDMIRLSTKLDVMVLVSGDGDYVPAVEFLRNQGHRIEVMGFRQSTSNKLAGEADEFIDMDAEHAKYLLAPKQTRKRRFSS
ncbi:MAG: hypothetical protein A2113_01750, partial [Candidatus Woykebacteria bacterium GWA1_44_8]